MAKTKNASKQETGGKKAAKKRASRGDPPIVVGGGGSTYIWILKSANPQLISPTGPTAPSPPPPPANPSDYYCFFCNVDIETIEANDGFPGVGHKVKLPGNPVNGKVDPTKHKTIFG